MPHRTCTTCTVWCIWGKAASRGATNWARSISWTILWAEAGCAWVWQWGEERVSSKGKAHTLQRGVAATRRKGLVTAVHYAAANKVILMRTSHAWAGHCSPLALQEQQEDNTCAMCASLARSRLHKHSQVNCDSTTTLMSCTVVRFTCTLAIWVSRCWPTWSK